MAMCPRCGCSATPPCGSVIIHSLDCAGNALPSCPVTVTGPGGFSFSGTTDGSGLLTVSIFVAGSYTIVIGPPGGNVRYGTSTTVTSLTCTTGQGRLITLPAASGYTSTCCDPTKWCQNPIKQTLNISDGLGSTTNPTPGSYVGSFSRSTANGLDVTCTTIAPVTVPVTWTLDCVVTGLWNVTGTIVNCTNPGGGGVAAGDYPYAGTSVSSSSVGGTQNKAADSCDPFSVTFPLSFASTSAFFKIYGGSTSVTFSE